jgi:hypothetical protein
MKTPCEIVTTKILPTVRAEIVKNLVVSYGMKQLEVAAKMGITQAAVSKYVSSSRGSDDELLRMFPQIADFAPKTAGRVVSNPSAKADIPLCRICRRIQATDAFDRYLQSFSRPTACKICDRESARVTR